MISGKAGSGKSTLGNKIVKEHLNRTPERPVFLFSPWEEDHSIDQGIEDKIKRIDPQNYEIDLFKGAIAVFDDVDSMSDERRVKAVYELIKKILEGGRRFGTDVIFINHTLRNNKRTKYVIQECNYFFFFPGSGNDAQILSFMKAYIGFSKTANKEILDTTDSRWVLIHNAYPSYVMTQHRIYFPPKDGDKKRKRT